jgi:hypothetical protein
LCAQSSGDDERGASDLDKVERIVKVLSYVNVAPGFTDMPKVANGESDLLIEVFGENGCHTRMLSACLR